MKEKTRSSLERACGRLEGIAALGSVEITGPVLCVVELIEKAIEEESDANG